jgi:serine protease
VDPDVLLIGIGGPGIANSDLDQIIMSTAKRKLVVVPAGNRASEGPVWPAVLPGVVAVAALDQTGKLAPFSNYGREIELAARGMNIQSLVGIDTAGQPELGLLNGTSLAAALVTGLASMLIARAGVEADIVGRLMESTAKKDDSVPAVDPVAAARAAINQLESNSPAGRRDSSGA